MDKLHTKIFIGTLLLWAATIVGANADGPTSSVQPGSVDDPVITKSYFDQNIKQKITEELNKQSITEEKVRQIISELGKGTTSSGSTQNTGTPPPSSGTSTDLIIVELKPGQLLYGNAGAEIIVRTGKTLVISTDDNGVANVTSGKDLAAGAAVENNHLLIVPRDGRGVKPDPKSKQDIFVMVRGSYVLQNTDGTKVTP